MAEENKHFLVEVLCGFWFNQEQNPWDSTFFGKFFELIERDGYTQKQEQQGYQVKFEFTSADVEKPTAQTDKLEPRMLFKNPEKEMAILMAANYISFHKLVPYSSWEDLLVNQIKPGLERYSSIGLGKGLLQVQMLYLNKYVFSIDANLSDTFNFIPAVEKFGIGKERSLLFQSQYELDPNLLQQIKLNSVPNPDNSKLVFLECSCLAINKTGIDDWLAIASQAHETNNKVYNTITKK